MSYQVREETRPTAGDRDGTVYILEDGEGSSRAEVWPALGFNCYLWQVKREGHCFDLLYADPNFFRDGRPTRSGIPILFPFPNRIRDGRFTWEGKEYRLPLNDASAKTAIHGFACRRPWRVVAHGADDAHAYLTAEFHGAIDAPETRSCWPADYQIRVTYRLAAQRLRIEAEIQNPDRVSLPFGLGYHPYSRIRIGPGGAPTDCRVEVPAHSFWQLSDCLPAGQRTPVDPPRDLNAPRLVSELTLDDVFTDLPEVIAPESKGLLVRGTLTQPADHVELRLLCSPAFREMVVFTPIHRQAICLEPYTCTTDAINLQQQGIDAGLRVLAPGETWAGVVEMVVS